MNWLWHLLPTSDIIGWLLPLATGWITTQIHDLLDKNVAWLNSLSDTLKQGAVILESAIITALAAAIPGVCGATAIAACTTQNLDSKMIAAALVAFAIKHSKQINGK